LSPAAAGGGAFLFSGPPPTLWHSRPKGRGSNGQGQLAELNKRIAAVQRTLARTHNTIIYGAAGAILTGFASVIAVSHWLEWPKWAVAVGAVVG